MSHVLFLVLIMVLLLQKGCKCRVELKRVYLADRGQELSEHRESTTSSKSQRLIYSQSARENSIIPISQSSVTTSFEHMEHVRSKVENYNSSTMEISSSLRGFATEATEVKHGFPASSTVYFTIVDNVSTILSLTSSTQAIQMNQRTESTKFSLLPSSSAVHSSILGITNSSQATHEVNKRTKSTKVSLFSSLLVHSGFTSRVKPSSSSSISSLSSINSLLVSAPSETFNVASSSDINLYFSREVTSTIQLRSNSIQYKNISSTTSDSSITHGDISVKNIGATSISKIQSISAQSSQADSLRKSPSSSVTLQSKLIVLSASVYSMSSDTEIRSSVGIMSKVFDPFTDIGQSLTPSLPGQSLVQVITSSNWSTLTPSTIKPSFSATSQVIFIQTAITPNKTISTVQVSSSIHYLNENIKEFGTSATKQTILQDIRIMVAVGVGLVVLILFIICGMVLYTHKSRYTNKPELRYSVKWEFIEEGKMRCLNSRLDLSIKGLHCDLEYSGTEPSQDDIFAGRETTPEEKEEIEQLSKLCQDDIKWLSDVIRKDMGSSASIASLSDVTKKRQSSSSDVTSVVEKENLESSEKGSSCQVNELKSLESEEQMVTVCVPEEDLISDEEILDEEEDKKNRVDNEYRIIEIDERKIDPDHIQGKVDIKHYAKQLFDIVDKDKDNYSLRKEKKEHIKSKKYRDAIEGDVCNSNL